MFAASMAGKQVIRTVYCRCLHFCDIGECPMVMFVPTMLTAILGVALSIAFAFGLIKLLKRPWARCNSGTRMRNLQAAALSVVSIMLQFRIRRL